MGRPWLVWLLVVVVAFAAWPRGARADQPGAHTVAVAVLAIDSEDAETQAEALTGALRSRIRNAQGWSLVETTQSLGMLTAALRCPSHPQPDCQQKIAEAVKVDRYIWGFVGKGPTQGQVTAEVHFYQKGKPDTVVKEAYADNLTDPNDDKGIGKVAAHILDRLGGSAMGIVVVHAGDVAGEVIVDGDKRVPLQAGQARIELGAGGHAIEVSTGSGPPMKRNVLVTAGKETIVEMAGEPPPPPPPPRGAAEPPSSPFPTQKVIAGALVVAGIALGVVSAVEYARYKSATNDGDKIDPHQLPPKTADKSSAELACDIQSPTDVQRTACNLDKDARNASTIAIITGIAGGLAIGGGIVLWVTDSGSSDKPAARRKARLVPVAGPGGGSLLLTGWF
jgi:hypothetical protein